MIPVDVSILIPMKNNAATLDALLRAIAAQDFDGTHETIIIDSGSTDGSLEIAASHNVQLSRIPPEQFHHGGTRNLLASRASGSYLVFVSADALPASRRWLAELVRECSPAGVAGVYSRQVPRDAASPLEAYFLGHLYGAHRREQRYNGVVRLDMSQTLFSNVSSCIKRELWQRFPFDETSIMSEDQIWSRHVLQAGYSLVYSPAAAVVHSHRYSVKGAFRRFFDSGSSSAASYMPAGAGGALRLFAHGARYFAGEVVYLVRERRPLLVPYAVVYEAAKFAGLLAGRQRHRLPRALVRRLSYYGRS